MGELKQATPQMFEEVYSTLLRRLDASVPRERWRNIFAPAWVDSPEDPVGYVLRERDRIVGFMGLIFAEREVDGTVEKFANVTSWIAEGGGARGAALLFPLRDLRSHTITNLTSTPNAYRIFRRFGFEVLDTHYQIVPALHPRRGRRRRVTEREEDITAVLTEADRGIYEDHAPYVRQLIAVDQGGYCHLVYSLVRRRGLRVAKVHHAGGEVRLTTALPDIGRFLTRNHGIMAFDCDDRLLGSTRYRWGVRRELSVPRLYRSESLAPPQVSELHSEMVLLGIG